MAYNKCKKDVAKEAKDLYNKLWDAAKRQYYALMDKATEGWNNLLKECETIDRSTLKGAIKYGGCVAGANAAYYAGTTYASLAYAGATTAIAGTITAFDAGQYGGCSLALIIESSKCKKDYDDCVKGQE